MIFVKMLVLFIVLFSL